MARETVDIAIVGGGVSGLYSAWRLAQPEQRASSKLCVFEACERLGGRLHTVDVPMLSCKVEMGAMRFTSSQLLVKGLLSHLGVTTEVFANSTLQHMFLRGVPIAMGPEGPLGPMPYRLAGTESPFPFALLAQAMMRAVPNAFTLTPRQWGEFVETQELNGRKLWEWGFWNLLQSFLSNEGYQLISQGLGEQSVSANWSAAFALPMMAQISTDARKTDGLHRATGGWVTLVDELAAKITSTPGCEIRMQQSLAGIRKSGDSDFPLELLFEADGGEQRVGVKKLILAMPREALERVDISREICDFREVLRLYEQVMQVPAFKLYAAYETPWWSSYSGWANGYSITDLPMRQVYYGAGQAGELSDTSRVLMASYADFTSVQFWSGLACMEPDHITTFEAVKNSGAEGPLNSLVETVSGQLQELHGISRPLPKPIWSAYADWTRGTYGAGWHAWLPGIDPKVAVPRMRQPFGDLPIHICGEAFSYYQGWVEGALSSAELMLEKHFELSPPTWLPTGYYLGP